MLKHDRLVEMEQYMIQKESVSIPELCAHFKISMNTARRDIDILASRGIIAKVYGGILLNKGLDLLPYPDRAVIHAAEKIKIAQIASRFVNNGDTIFIDSGTTTVHMIPFLSHMKELTIVSHSLDVFQEASKHQNFNIISLGGVLNFKTYSFIGMLALKGLQDLHINKCFMATVGLALDAGLTSSSFFEAEIKKTVLNKSMEKFVLADSTKIGTISLIKVAPLDAVNAIITDAEPSMEYVEFCREKGVKILCA